MASKVWRTKTPTLDGEPERWDNGSKFFGYYSLGHVMVKARVTLEEIEIGAGITTTTRVEIPPRCRQCGAEVGDIRLMRTCEEIVPPILTTTGLNAEIASEKRASEAVALLGPTGLELRERGTLP